jgi:CheY-like chemotaxis protein
VDDNEPDAGSVKAYLERNNYRVVLVTNGSDAITQVQVQAPSLILIDTQVAQMDVPETVRQLRQLPTMGRIPIIALTALTLPSEREACLAAGADAYMSKPLCLQALHTLRVNGH